MNISYKKDGQQKYMVVRDVELEDDNYQLQMLLNNHIEGLVTLVARNVNNKSELWYDTTTLVTAQQMFSKKLMTGEDVIYFIRALNSVTEITKNFLIDINNIWFAMDMIFLTREGKKYKFCWKPNNEVYFQDGLRNLFDELLEYIDHNDKKAVLICYGIQQITIGDDFTVGDLLEYANRKFNYKEPEAIENEKVDICYRNEVESIKKKESIFQRLRKFIVKDDRYATVDDLDNHYELVQEECDFDENRTVLLTGSLVDGISFRSIDQEQELIIRPKNFPCIVGSSIKSSDLYLNNPVVSRVHMRLTEEDGEYFIEDLNSTNGTFINGERVKAHQLKRIEIGDVITIANLQFTIE